MMSGPPERDLADEFQDWIVARARELHARGYTLWIDDEEKRRAFRSKLTRADIGTVANSAGITYQIGDEGGTVNVWGNGNVTICHEPAGLDSASLVGYFRLHGVDALHELLRNLFADVEAWSKGAPPTSRYVTDGERDLWPGTI